MVFPPSFWSWFSGWRIICLSSNKYWYLVIIEAIFRGKWAINAFHKNAKRVQTAVANFTGLHKVNLGYLAHFRAKFGGFYSIHSWNIDQNVYFPVFARHLFFSGLETMHTRCFYKPSLRIKKEFYLLNSNLFVRVNEQLECVINQIRILY